MGKQYAILRVQKCKGAEIGAMQYHNDREPGKHTNPDIDQSRTRMNREMCPHADYEGEVQARIDAGYKGTRKVRKDAVRLVEGIVTASPEFFEGASAEEVRDFFEDALGFCREEFGESNLVHFTVHMDEETPHAHFGFTPIKDGTLSWKNYFDGRDALRGFQNRYWERVGKQWGLERGETGSGRTHKTTQEMKREAQREIKELDKRKECLRQEVEEMEAATPSLSEGVRTLWKARSDGSREEELGSAIEGLRGRISDLSSQIADCNGRAEGIERGLPALRARYRELAERFNDTRSRVEQALGRLREVPNTLSELAQDIARKLGKPLFDPGSLDYQMREVTRVAKALDRDRPHVPQQRGREAR